MTNPVSRMGLDHPDLATAGGASLFARVETLYKSLANPMSTRWLSAASLANGATTTLTHGLRIGFAQLRFAVYTASDSNEVGTADHTRILEGASGVSIVETGANPTTQIDIINNSGGTLTNLRVLVWQDFHTDYQRIVDPSLTASGRIYATLAAAIAAAAAGDKILVKGTHNVTSGVAVNVADLTIEWAPLAKLTSSGAATELLSISAARCRLIAPYLRSDGASVTHAIKVSAADLRIVGGIVESNNAAGMTSALQINSGGVRAIADLGLIATSGTITNDFDDTVVQTLRGSFGR